MNYYERHIGDYLKDTAHLSLLEHGVYGRLLDVYYIRESALDEGEAMRLIGARSKEERAAVSSVLREFFHQDQGSGYWFHKRCEAEVLRYRDKQRKAKASAEIRWSAAKSHSEGNANASPNAMRTHSEGSAPSLQTPDTRHQETPPNPRKRGSVHGFPPGFDHFWEAYPKKVAKDAAAKAFAKRKVGASLLSAMLAAIRVQAGSEAWRKDGGQFIPHPSTWLNEGRWQDEQGGPSAGENDAWRGAI